MTSKEKHIVERLNRFLEKYQLHVDVKKCADGTMEYSLNHVNAYLYRYWSSIDDMVFDSSYSIFKWAKTNIVFSDIIDSSFCSIVCNSLDELEIKLDLLDLDNAIE